MTPRDELRLWLAGRSADQLHQTLLLRPDVLWGAPVRDLDDLADRLVHAISVAAIVSDLPAPALQTLEVLSAAGAGASPERAAALLDARASGRDDAAHREHIDRCVRALGEGALVWPRPDGRLVLNPGLHEVIPYPLGFGRPVEVLVANVPVADLKRVLKRWGRPSSGRRAELVDAVCTFLADGSQVRRLVGQAPASVARVLVDRSQRTARLLRPGAPAEAGDSGARRDADLDDGAYDGAYDDGPGGYEYGNGYLDFMVDPEAYSANQSAVRWAHENGLGFNPYNMYSGHIELPSEAILALVGADFRAPFEPVPPAVAEAAVTDDQVRSSAAGAITEFLATAMAVFESMSRSPLAGLKAGGVGARELKRVAKLLGATEPDLRLALELGLWLNLLRRDDAGSTTTSPRFDAWRRRSPAERAADLLATWFELGYVPTIDRFDDGRSVPALARATGSELARSIRLLAFSHLAQLEDGKGVAAIETLADRIAWRLPLLMADGANLDLGATWAEAERLGVIAHGRLSAAGGVLLLDDDDDARELTAALDGLVPEVQTKALFGSDLTVVVPGSPAPAVVDLLDAVAVREGRGAASTWRVTPESLRGALDAGHDAGDLVDRLRGLTDGTLPQALEYLIQDVGRRYGHAQVRPAGAVIQSDDDALLAEVAVHRALRRLGLHRIAPTVLLAEAPAADVVPALRAAGYLPLELDVAGERVVGLRARQSPGAAAAGLVTGPHDPGSDELGSDGTSFDELSDEDASEALREWMAEFSTERMHAAGLAGLAGSVDAATSGELMESVAQVAARLAEGVRPALADRSSAIEHQIQLAAPRLSGDEVRQLAHAVEHAEPVKLVYRSTSGGLTVRVVSALRLEPGHLVGWCHLRQDERTFALTSIQSVTPAPPQP